MPLNPYFASRNLIIRVSDSPLDDEGSLRAVHILDVPHGGEPRDEIIDKIAQVLDEYEITDGFAIKDTRGVFEAGASGSSQEVILTIWQAVISGGVEGIVGAAIGWGAAKYSTYKKSGGDTMENNFEHQPGSAFERIREHFGGSGELMLEDEERGSGSYKAVIRDSLGRRFRVESDDEGRETIRKLP